MPNCVQIGLVVFDKKISFVLFFYIDNRKNSLAFQGRINFKDFSRQPAIFKNFSRASEPSPL